MSFLESALVETMILTLGHQLKTSGSMYKNLVNLSMLRNAVFFQFNGNSLVAATISDSKKRKRRLSRLKRLILAAGWLAWIAICGCEV